jgi:ABC-type microcin C transport system permease subunit YejE
MKNWNFKDNEGFWSVIIFQSLFIVILLTIINSQSSPIELRDQMRNLQKIVNNYEINKEKNSLTIADYGLNGLNAFYDEYRKNMNIMDQNFNLKNQIDENHEQRIRAIEEKFDFNMKFHKDLLNHLKLEYEGINK